MDKTLPSFVSQYFWGDDLQSLDIHKHQQYIIQTLLENGNQQALHWLFTRFDKEMIVQLLSSLKLTKKSSHFWSLYLS